LISIQSLGSKLANDVVSKHGCRLQYIPLDLWLLTQPHSISGL